MQRMLRAFTILLLAGTLMGSSACGFLHNPRTGKAYANSTLFESTIDSCTGALVTWPFHVVVFTFTSIIDQTIHTFESIPWAGADAVDYVKLRGNGNNIMLERTIAVPKLIATPLVFVGSYIVRWLLPLGDSRAFDIEKDKPSSKPVKSEPGTEPVAPEKRDARLNSGAQSACAAR